MSGLYIRVFLVLTFILGIVAPWQPSAPVRASADATLRVSARATGDTVAFTIDGVAPAGAEEVILWYDTPAGRRGQRFRTSAGASLQRTVQVSVASERARTDPALGRRLDYWWAVVGDGATLERRTGVVVLPPNIATAGTVAPTALPRWAETKTEHYVLRYYPGSPAERDIERIKLDAEAAYDEATAVITPTERVRITVYLVPRVFWQGGVAYDGSTVMVTYADRNYAGVALRPYLTHETIHALAHGLVKRDGEVGGLIGEGIATFGTGGHYGPEPIDAWAATLARSDRFVPLCRIRADFRDIQHEIAYLEGASFVGYLIRTYGLERFQRFYAEEPAVPDDADERTDEFCAAEATRPVVELGVTYADLEAGWRAYLDTVMPAPEQSAAFWGQLRFFDLVRAYEEQHDPDARIMPPPPRRWNAQVWAAFATPAMSETNTVLESMFIAADRALDDGEAAEANAILDEIERALPTGTTDGALGRHYGEIASALRRYSRAQRLGDADLAATVTPMPLQDDVLWGDYRLSLDAVTLHSTSAWVRATLHTQPLGGAAQHRGVLVRVVRQHTGWRIAMVISDPARPAQSVAPSAAADVIAYNSAGTEAVAWFGTRRKGRT